MKYLCERINDACKLTEKDVNNVFHMEDIIFGKQEIKIEKKIGKIKKVNGMVLNVFLGIASNCHTHCLSEEMEILPPPISIFNSIDGEFSNKIETNRVENYKWL